MSFPSFDAMPPWAMLLSLAVHLAAGIGLGAIYFRGVWQSALRFTGGAHAGTTIALMLGRFTLLGTLLTLASQEGALPLLMMALGVVIARSASVRRVRRAAS
jgi:N-ATPase, AtpR subunit